MSAYTVETRASGCVVVAVDRPATHLLALNLHRRGVEPLLLDPNSDASPSILTEYLLEHDLDYLIVFDSPAPALLSLITGQGYGTLLSINGALAEAARQVNLGEFISPGFCPTLDHFLSEALGEGTLTLSVGGITDYSLLSAESLVSCLVHCLFLPTFPTTPVLLANPAPTSLLALANQLLPLLPHRAKLVFADANLSAPVYDYRSLDESYAKLGLNIDSDFAAALMNYVKNFAPTTRTTHHSPIPPTGKTAPTAPTAHAKHTGPSSYTAPAASNPQTGSLKSHLSHLEFVPVNQPNRLSRLRSSLPHFSSLLPHKNPHGRTAKLQKNKTNIHPLRRIVLHGLGIALALYLGTLAFAGTLVGLHLRSLRLHLSGSKLPDLTISPLLKTSATYLQANLVAISSFPPLREAPLIQELNLLSDAYLQFLDILRLSSTLSGSIHGITNHILGEGTGDIVSAISTSRLYTENLYQEISLLDGTLPAQVPTLLHDHTTGYHAVKSLLASLKKNLLVGKAVLAVAPDFLAVGKRAKYLMLFQNNLEIRGTGGFAVLSFENGHLYDMPVYDVYQADGQLKGHVEPPTPIKNILGEANWFLRDSNFDPDFPTSARRAEWFLKKTLNLDVDGTIGLTLDTLRALLVATGPLTLADYNETVSADNVAERAQYHAEVNFFPGSTAKKEYLSAVADGVITALRGNQTLDPLSLFTVLGDVVGAHNLQISSVDPSTERVWSTLGWNGAITDLPCPSSGPCAKDYAMLVDSNFGVNKANFYVTRKFKDEITISKEGKVSHIFLAQYQNSATSNAWPLLALRFYPLLYHHRRQNLGRARLHDWRRARQNRHFLSPHRTGK